MAKKYDYKKVIQESLIKEYGFAPSLEDISIVVSNHNDRYVSYVMFTVNGHTYDYVKNDNCEYVNKRK